MKQHYGEPGSIAVAGPTTIGEKTFVAIVRRANPKNATPTTGYGAELLEIDSRGEHVVGAGDWTDRGHAVSDARELMRHKVRQARAAAR